MANSITLFKKYIALLDEVYKQAALTSVLDGNSALMQQGANANEIIIPKLTMDGLADYSRNGGYVNGSVTLTNETVKFNYDRGRKFSVDAMDDDETAGIAFGSLASEFGTHQGGGYRTAEVTSDMPKNERKRYRKLTEMYALTDKMR